MPQQDLLQLQIRHSLYQYCLPESTYVDAILWNTFVNHLGEFREVIQLKKIIFKLPAEMTTLLETYYKMRRPGLYDPLFDLSHWRVPWSGFAIKRLQTS